MLHIFALYQASATLYICISIGHQLIHISWSLILTSMDWPHCNPDFFWKEKLVKIMLVVTNITPKELLIELNLNCNILLNSKFQTAFSNLFSQGISKSINWSEQHFGVMREQIACERMFTLASLCETLPFTFLHWFKVNSSLWYGTNDLTERPSFPSTFPGAFTLSQTLCQTSITPQAQLTGPLKDAIYVFCHKPQVFQVFGTLSLFS